MYPTMYIVYVQAIILANYSTSFGIYLQEWKALTFSYTVYGI